MTSVAADVNEVTDAVADLETALRRHRCELVGYCYRMLGSSFDAEDAVQETLVRAWRGHDKFEGRSALRSWLYRIATNVCLDMMSGRSRRARPMDLSAAAWQPVESSLAARQPENTWLEPILDAQLAPAGADPADQAVARESIRLAFVAALQYLPPRQRAVLILRDVLRWKAGEVAALMDTSVASVNSALQRARASISDRAVSSSDAFDPLDAVQQELLARYVQAFERYDVDALVELLHEDATQNMPPFEMWLRGSADIVAWMLGPGQGCRGSRFVTTVANGAPALAQYRPSGPGGLHQPFSLIVFDIVDGRIAGTTNFLDTALFALLGLPAHPNE
jgi:RNA polymerase sigma-70 factor (ECF subfamily)